MQRGATSNCSWSATAPKALKTARGCNLSLASVVGFAVRWAALFAIGVRSRGGASLPSAICALPWRAHSNERMLRTPKQSGHRAGISPGFHN